MKILFEKAYISMHLKALGCFGLACLCFWLEPLLNKLTFRCIRMPWVALGWHAFVFHKNPYWKGLHFHTFGGLGWLLAGLPLFLIRTLIEKACISMHLGALVALVWLAFVFDLNLFSKSLHFDAVGGLRLLWAGLPLFLMRIHIVKAYISMHLASLVALGWLAFVFH